ncbi:ATP-binding protein [Rheinheimera sp.]|uniref:ATP-binding protein n=1 Tax=Rheinheimera sp. TaxID=1869214 RepID=UPI00307F1128
MGLVLVFELIMLLTAACAALMAGWLWWHSRYQRLLAGLAGFGAMMAFWCLGHIFVLHQQPVLGSSLLLANPLMPTFFLHFAIQFVRQGSPDSPWLERLSAAIGWLYFTSVLVILLSLSLGASELVPGAVLPVVFVFSGYGWLNLLYTVLLGVAAHAVLWYGWRHHSGNKKRSIGAMFLAGGWGLLLATSFVFPSFGLDWFPYPMLLLPTYPVLLVYGVVRYQMLAANAIANRALLWLVMSLLLLLVIALISTVFGQLGMQTLATVPVWQLWLYSSLVLLLTAACYRPVARLAERLIYPGARLDQQILQRWQLQLASAADWQELAATAQQLLTSQLGKAVLVQLDRVQAGDGDLRLTATQQQGHWQSLVRGDEELTPGLRLVVQVFASLLQSRCATLQQSLQLADTEKQRLSSQHLVEMGALAASMAHELRNPLNIISMASAGVDSELRGHIQQQLKRADRLISDMLVYSGRLELNYSQVPLRPLIESLLQQLDWQQVQLSLQVPAELWLWADPHRLQQVLLNLLDNAHAFLRNQPDARLCIEALELPGQVRLRLHNNGPALDPAVSAQLFRPFISKRAGGSGLGLAIIKRIIDAHQGQICHRADLGWAVTFEFSLPKEPADVG